MNKILLLLFPLLFAFSCSENTDSKSLKIGMMPAVDAIPFYYALDAGLFKAAGIDVEITMFTNAQNRQSALQADAIDGAMSDLVALVTNVANGFPLKATMSTEGVFPLLINDKFPADIPVVAMMEVSVSNYLVEQYLSNKLYSKIFINEIPLRLQAVASGQVQMGLFPEPVASLGASMGLNKQLYDGIPSQSLDLMAFTGKAVKEKSATLKIFHRVYNQACTYLRDHSDVSRDIMMKYIPNLPEEIKNQVHLPFYADAHLPDQNFIQGIIDWTATLLGTPLSLKPADLLERKFLNP